MSRTILVLCFLLFTAILAAFASNPDMHVLESVPTFFSVQENNVFSVRNIPSLKANFEMHSSQQPMITWSHESPCTSGNVTIKALMGLGAPIQNFSFAGEIQRFRLPHKLLSKEIYTAQVFCHDGRISQTEKFSVNLNQEDWDPSIWIQGSKTNIFRKRINLTQAQNSSLYITVAGYYKLWVNGRLINNETHLDVATTHYSISSLAVAYHDIQLQQGENVIAVSIGNGWMGATQIRRGYGKTPTFRIIVFGDDSRPVAFTDDSWKTQVGPITVDNLYDGETYDSRLEIPGWNSVGFNDSQWINSIRVQFSDFNPAISLRSFPPVRTNSTIAPVNMTNPRPGIWVLDFGRTISGFTSVINVTGAAGENVTLQHGEIMDHFDPSRQGLVYFLNMWEAASLDTYILSGKGNESYTPSFVVHGYRFAQIQNWPNGSVPTIDNFRAIQIYSAVETIGSFHTDKDILNTIHQMTVWTQANNLMSIPSACNNRADRDGWMADAWLFAPEAFYNFDMVEFYRNFLNLIRVEQYSSGNLPNVVPGMGDDGHSDPTWDSAYTFLLENYFARNDTDTIQLHFQGAKDYTDYVLEQYRQTGLASLFGAFGDWVPPAPAGKVPIQMASSHSFIRSVKDISRYAEVLGYEDIRAEYTEIYNKLIAEYNKAFFNSTSQNYGQLQTSDLLPLDLGIALNGTDLSLLQKIGDLKNHFDSGIVGINLLFPILTQIGRTDVALALALQTSYPSYAYMWLNGIETPATTLWEYWNAATFDDPGVSRDQPMWGTIDAWFYKSLGGIDNEKVSVSIPNTYYTPLRKVEAKTRTHLGEIAVKWERVGGTVCAEETQPADLKLDCGLGAIESIEFVSVGQPTGTCATYSQEPQCTTTIDLSSCIGKTQCSLSNWWEGAQNCNNSQTKIAVRAKCALPHSMRVTVRAPKTVNVSIPVPPLSGARVFGSHLASSLSLHSGTSKYETSVPQGQHQFTISGEHTLRQVSTESSMTIALKCPVGMQIVGISNVKSPCHPQVLIHHIEASCMRSPKCIVDLSPVSFYTTSKCVEKSTVQYECGF